MSQVWANVGLDIGTLGTAQAVSGVTKANPGVMTYTGTDPANGDYLAVFATGMSRIDGRVFRGANLNSAGNTIELEGQDTSTFSTFASGSFQPVTWGTSMATVREVNSSGGDAKTVDDSTIHTDQDRMRVTGVGSHTITLTNKWLLSDPALIELKKASDTMTLRAFRFRFPDGAIIAGLAYVSAPMIPTGSRGANVDTSVTLYVQGPVTAYAS